MKIIEILLKFVLGTIVAFALAFIWFFFMAYVSHIRGIDPLDTLVSDLIGTLIAFVVGAFLGVKTGSLVFRRYKKGQKE